MLLQQEAEPQSARGTGQFQWAWQNLGLTVLGAEQADRAAAFLAEPLIPAAVAVALLVWVSRDSVHQHSKTLFYK
jgi:hypothetical protein